jgi:hypothetical protein
MLVAVSATSLLSRLAVRLVSRWWRRRGPGEIRLEVAVERRAA